jgi:hypothetical protein
MESDERRDVLWRLTAKRSTVRCVLRAERASTELILLQDEEIAFRESFPDEDTARVRATALQERLLTRGWKQAG